MPTDAELLERWSDGDGEAARTLIDRYFDHLCAFFRTKVKDDVVEDLIQQTFLICVRKRDALESRSSFKSYLFTVAKNEVYGYFRGAKKRGDPFDPGKNSVIAIDPSASSIMADKEAQTAVLGGLQRLPMDLQILLELRFWEDMTGPELAEVLDIPEGTVRSRLRRGLSMLREHLDAPPSDDDSDLEQSFLDLRGWASNIRKKVETDE